MLLTGTFYRTLDEKHRVSVPKKWRMVWGDSQPARVYIAPGTDGSLSLYTEESFSSLAEQLAIASPTGPDVRAFSRLFYAQAQPVELDSQGRVRIPAELVKLAALRREVVMVGIRDHFELWDRERWDTYLSDKQAHYDEIAERAFDRTG
jgi:MraZ protein